MNSIAKFVHILRRHSVGFTPIAPNRFAAPLINGLIEEETLPHYRPELFHPTRLGEVINNRYQIVTKLGYGTSSTVWLARDNQKWPWQAHRWVTLKILCRSSGVDGTSKAELEVSQSITTTDPRCEGRRYLRTVLDSFEIAGPDGAHLGLVYEPMRESLSRFQRRFPEGKMPGYFLKPLLTMVLTGIEYLHEKCHIIHTDLKPDNILLSIESRAAIDELVKREIEEPSPCKLEGTRAIYPSRNFGDLERPPGPPRIADFGLAVSGDVSIFHTHPIQADLFQAPEVILEAGWTYSADIWNLGVTVWDLVENETLFDATDPVRGDYSAGRHLEEMTAFLGPPPKDLLRRAKLGASYFTSEGKLLRSHGSVPNASSLETSLISFVGEEKTLFLAFLRKMLRWAPEDRASAQGLLKDPWLKS